MKSKFLKKLFPVLLVGIAAAIGVTGATIVHKLTLENPIKTPTVTSKINEDEEKHVSFTNTGEADVFLRASFSETWLYTENGGDSFIVLPNKAKTISGTPESVDVAVPDIDPDDMWIDGGDGWYYYKHILRGSASKGTGSSETEYLINEVIFADLTDIVDTRYADTTTDDTPNTYSDYQIHVVTEVVQASDEVQVSIDAVKELFDKDISLTEFPKDPDDSGLLLISGKYSTDVDWVAGNGGGSND